MWLEYPLSTIRHRQQHVKVHAGKSMLTVTRAILKDAELGALWKGTITRVSSSGGGAFMLLFYDYGRAFYLERNARPAGK